MVDNYCFPESRQLYVNLVYSSKTTQPDISAQCFVL